MTTTDRTAITLTQQEWNLVTTALLCLEDVDDNRGYEKERLECDALRRKIRRVLGEATE